MAAKLSKDSIDLGIVITDSEASLAFYRDLLGFVHVADTPLPSGLVGTMHRLLCGRSMIKLLKVDPVPELRPNRGGARGATGYRFFSIYVDNIEEVTRAAQAAGYGVRVDIAEARPGTRISIVEDPDGNSVELIEDNS